MNWIKPCAAESACVEVARDGDRVLLRDSKDTSLPPLVFPPSDWVEFISAMTAGSWRYNTVTHADNSVTVYAPKHLDGPYLLFDAGEWAAFEASVVAGEYALGRLS